jgi:hypothetical protein
MSRRFAPRNASGEAASNATSEQLFFGPDFFEEWYPQGERRTAPLARGYPTKKKGGF